MIYFRVSISISTSYRDRSETKLGTQRELADLREHPGWWHCPDPEYRRRSKQAANSLRPHSILKASHIAQHTRWQQAINLHYQHTSRFTCNRPTSHRWRGSEFLTAALLRCGATALSSCRRFDRSCSLRQAVQEGLIYCLTLNMKSLWSFEKSGNARPTI